MLLGRYDQTRSYYTKKPSAEGSENLLSRVDVRLAELKSIIHHVYVLDHQVELGPRYEHLISAPV